MTSTTDINRIGNAIERAVAAEIRDRSPVRSSRRLPRARLLAIAAVSSALLATTAVAVVRASHETESVSWAQCLNSHGAHPDPTESIQPGQEFGLIVSDEANAACSYLALASSIGARNEPKDLEEWALKLGPRPVMFWRCIGEAGYPIPGFSRPEVSVKNDFNTPSFKTLVGLCASKVGENVAPPPE